MGLLTIDLGMGDQLDIQTINRDLINTLRKAHKITDENIVMKETCRYWFGDDSLEWRRQLSVNLNRMATLINILPIKIQYTHIHNRISTRIACALMGPDDYIDYTQDLPPLGFITATHAQISVAPLSAISLDSGWSTLQLLPHCEYLDSKFKTIAHELTHILLGTYDLAYGITQCLNLGMRSPYTAKNNADNWAYFIAELYFL